jgi:iron(III) transport system ATP-binding protein
MAKSIIEIKNISYSFWGETVLDDISMSFPAGKLITITGPSGSGKSHFLKIVAGLIEPDSGAVFIDGVDISELSRGQLFQSSTIYPCTTILLCR